MRLLSNHPIMTRTILGAAAVLGLALCTGCGDDIGQGTDNMTDSFVNPTEHGELIFGVPNQAQFTEEQRFHSWGFVLTDTAKVDLGTELHTTNLDSVMYLYKREPGAENWGSYVAKNDDHAGSLASHIEAELGAGEYRIKIKAAKENLRGDFSLVGACDGAGCPAAAGDACAPNSPIGADYGKDFTDGCGQLLLDILYTPVTAEWNTEVLWGEHCELGGLPARSALYYHDYWDSFLGWDDMFYDPEEAFMYLRVTEYGEAGTLVSIDVGGDEDNVTFAYDHDDKLIMYFHSEQSSSTGWTCGVEGEPSTAYPNEECAGQGIYAITHKAAEVDTSEGTTTPASAAGDLQSEMLGKVVGLFAAERGVAPGDPVVYVEEQWESGSGLTLTANGATTTFYTGGWYGDSIVARTDGDLTRFVCQSLE